MRCSSFGSIIEIVANGLLYELFYILKGKMIMEFRDKKVEVNEGEIIVVPKGVEHRPIAEEEVWMMLFEPQNIKHTGDVKSDLTIDSYEKI